MIVLDASATVELVLSTPTGQQVAARITEPDMSLHAPHLLSVEVAHVLRRFAAAGSVTSPEAEAALEDLQGLDIHRWEHEPLLPRVWELRDNVTAYDAVYVALAETLGAMLLTTDRRLARLGSTAATIEVVGPLP